MEIVYGVRSSRQTDNFFKRFTAQGFYKLLNAMGAKVIYIEVFDRYDKPTLTGRLVYPIADKFIVQWEEEKKVYPKAICLGSIF